MRTLTRNEVPGLGLAADQAVFLDSQFDRQSKVVVARIEGDRVAGLAIYHRGYFETLLREGLLPSVAEDQLVIGLD